jgi:hypothetical protein
MNATKWNGRSIVDITQWTLLGLAVDACFKAYARHGQASMVLCPVYENCEVKLAHVATQGRQTWPQPGVDRMFQLTDSQVTLGAKLATQAAHVLSAAQWRVFDGDIDVKRGQRIVGAVDGVADNLGIKGSTGLVEVKVRKFKEHGIDRAELMQGLDTFWTAHGLPRLKTPWTHGILIVIYQVNPHRSYPRDFIELFLWARGKPGQVLLERRSCSPNISIASVPVALPVAAAVAPPQKNDVPKWTAIKDRLDTGLMQGKAAVKVASYLRACGITGMKTQDALAIWKHHLKWKKEVVARLGGSRRGTKRSGGQLAFFILKTELLKVHRLRRAGQI